MNTGDLQNTSHYLLGYILHYEPSMVTWPSYEGHDAYTIASESYKNWLPAAHGTQGGTGGASGAVETLSFLLDVPSEATGASSPPTITLTDFKARIANIKSEVAVGGGLNGCQNCIYIKYRVEREIRNGGTRGYRRFDETIGSGLAGGTLAHTEPHAWQFEYEAVLRLPEERSTAIFQLLDRDAELFRIEWPGRVYTAWPLPAGEYGFFYDVSSSSLVPCDGLPEEAKRKQEVFVQVVPLEWTIHEAFFDPVATGSAVGADASSGVLEPAGFSLDGSSTTITSLKWENASVVLSLDPHVSLTNKGMDIIALDGAVPLSLEVSDAVVDAAVGTFTWSVTSQPWSSGDQLMLRIRRTNQLPTFDEGADTTRSLPENSLSGILVGAPLTATDADGDSLTYGLSGEDADAFEINPASGQLRTKIGQTYDYETQQTYSPTVTVEDIRGGAASIDVVVSLTDVDESGSDTPPHRWNISVSPDARTRPADGQTTIDVRVSVTCNGSLAFTQESCPFEPGSVTFQIQADGSEPGEATHRDDFGGPRISFKVRHGYTGYYGIRLNLRPGSGDAEYIPFVLMQEGVGKVDEARFNMRSQVPPFP